MILHFQWEPHGRGCFILGSKSSEICAGIIGAFLASPGESVLSPEQVLALIQSNICRPFFMLVKLGGQLLDSPESLQTPEFEAEFDNSFAIGPGGLHGLLPYLRPAYLAVAEALAAGASCSVTIQVHEELVDLSAALLRCMQHLRFKHNRSQWDPRHGCRELSAILDQKDSSLPVCAWIIRIFLMTHTILRLRHKTTLPGST